MPRRDADLLVEDILAAIRKIERYTAGMEAGAFQRDEKTVDAVVRNLEIIGEATRRFLPDFTDRYPEVPWRKVAGMRNRIVHDYFGLDLEIIWQVVQSDLPALKTALEGLAPEASENP
jgi:uncharacterized protein with HEPN domain